MTFIPITGYPKLCGKGVAKPEFDTVSWVTRVEFLATACFNVLEHLTCNFSDAKLLESVQGSLSCVKLEKCKVQQKCLVSRVLIVNRIA